VRAETFNAIRRTAESRETWFLTGDLGYGQVQDLESALGDRFINVGVAEQNLVSVASGLALVGASAYVYSIGPFLTLRAADQIRMGPVVHELDVTLICGGAGLLYGNLGFSHYALQDVALMRSFPGMTVLAPTTARDLDRVLSLAVTTRGPKYLRLERGPTGCDLPSLEDGPSFDGADLVIAGYGDVMNGAATAAEELRELGMAVGVVTTPIIDGSVGARLAEVLRGVPAVISVEEHVPGGGIGAEIAMTLASQGASTRLSILAVDARALTEFGGRAHLQHVLEVDSAAIVAAARRLLNT
jgi:transketolase